MGCGNSRDAAPPANKVGDVGAPIDITEAGVDAVPAHVLKAIQPVGEASVKGAHAQRAGSHRNIQIVASEGSPASSTRSQSGKGSRRRAKNGSDGSGPDSGKAPNMFDMDAAAPVVTGSPVPAHQRSLSVGGGAPPRSGSPGLSRRVVVKEGGGNGSPKLESRKRGSVSRTHDEDDNPLSPAPDLKRSLSKEPASAHEHGHHLGPHRSGTPEHKRASSVGRRPSVNNIAGAGDEAGGSPGTESMRRRIGLAAGGQKKELSLAQQVMQRNLAAEHSDFHGPEGEHVPMPYDRSQSPLLSARSLPRHDSHHHHQHHGMPHAPSAPAGATPHVAPHLDRQGSMTTAKTDKLWRHYAGSGDAKYMYKKGAMQLSADLFEEFLERYREKLRETSKLPPGQYTDEKVEADLHADLPHLLPAQASGVHDQKHAPDGRSTPTDGLGSYRGHKHSAAHHAAWPTGAGKPSKDDYIRYVFRFLLNEMTKPSVHDASADHSARESVQREKEKHGGAKLTKLEFMQGWSRGQALLFHTIDNIKADDKGSPCKLM